MKDDFEAVKNDVLNELRRYESGLDCAGRMESQMFADWYSDLGSGRATVAETVYRIVMQLNHENGNADIAMNFLQILTGEDEPIQRYDYLSEWCG